MRVDILHGSTIIWTGQLEHLDPPMGVAVGPFTPADQYDRDQHANVVEGDYIGDRGKALVACVDNQSHVNDAIISIADFTDTLGELEITVFFQDHGEYEGLFSGHYDYKAYYSASDQVG